MEMDAEGQAQRRDGGRAHAAAGGAASAGDGAGGRAAADEAARAQRCSGAGLLIIGVLALLRALLAAQPAPEVWTLGEPIPLEIESLAGEDFRLLPGVGPVLAARLEAARIAAGGRLLPGDLHAVPGVGPSLRSRWQALRTH